ncbi:hypothetical protein L1987_25277 [Smallanthus sonchifolius]|uniref:Uncharacterized protein n=1 Tax=Smallanthus sonchifolius TaxID=185202 RepID=A0ACB9IP74_9ASTR|nr:hypothetical protein L1987_25277 [Smallanthus sonchifolius]
MTVWRLTNQEGDSVKKHGIGKGLMTIRRLTNAGAQNLPTCVDNHHGAFSQFPPSTSQKPTQRKKKSRKQPTVTVCLHLLDLFVQRRLVNKVQEKKSSVRSKKVLLMYMEASGKNVGKYEIALVVGRSEEDQSQYAMLVDDEELELRKLQETSNPLTWCGLCAVNLLAKFPPNSVRMKQPFHMQPWDSSQLVKKLFKIFHFVSTYAVIIGIQSFTLDELAQAFIDKDSLLLGKLNIALLKLLLTGVEKKLDSVFVSHICKNWKYRAGFGSKRDKSPKEPLNKEAALMASYDLSQGTLKGELFSILLLQGNIGMKISELATYSSNDEDDQSDLEDYGSVDDDPKDLSHYHDIVDLEDGSNASEHGQKNLDLNIEEKLNALLALSSMPEGAVVGAWTKSAHNIWVKQLRRTSTPVQLLQILADFVGSINKGWVYESDSS